jgi:hypothetical protein
MELHCNCHDTNHEGCKLEQPEQSGPLVLSHGVQCFPALCDVVTNDEE